MALYRSPLASQNWGEQPEYSQAPTAPEDKRQGMHLLSAHTPGRVAPTRFPAGAHTEQHHDVSQFQRSASPRPDPLHLGHPGPLALQPGKLLITGGWSANTHTTQTTALVPSGLQRQGTPLLTRARL